jgi:hypothetical protein
VGALRGISICFKESATPAHKLLGFSVDQSVHTNTINQTRGINQMALTTNEFTIDEVGFIQIALTKVLAAAARGELDLNRLAREELAARGLDDKGVWVGFDRAKEIHKV